MLQHQRDHLGRFLPKGKALSHVRGLSGDMRTRIGALLQAGPKGLQIGSGFRSVQHQKRLWNNALKKYGSAAKARKWVAPPGRSQHNHGQASDIWFNGRRLDKAPAEVRQWVHDNAGQYGLAFPLGNEPWHIEVAGARSGKIKPYTAPTQIAQAPTPRSKPTLVSPLPDSIAKQEPDSRARQLFAQTKLGGEVPSQDTLTPQDRTFGPTQLALDNNNMGATDLIKALQEPTATTPQQVPDGQFTLAQALQDVPPHPVPGIQGPTPQPLAAGPQFDIGAPANLPGMTPLMDSPINPGLAATPGGANPMALAGLIEALTGGGSEAPQIELPPLARPMNQVAQMPVNQQRMFL